MAWMYNGSEITPNQSFLNTDGYRVGKGWAKLSSDGKAALGITWQDDPSPSVDLATLKTDGIATIKNTARRLQETYDWYIIRKYELGTDVPAAVTTYRAAVKTACDSIIADINACTTVDQYNALNIDDAENLDDWPDLPSV